jgi:Putative transposase DNA-binding domain
LTTRRKSSTLEAARTFVLNLELRERAISANELLSWAEACTVETKDHPHPSSGWNFSARFPDLPYIYRRSVIKDAIGKVRSYLSQRARWEKSSTKKGEPGHKVARSIANVCASYPGCVLLFERLRKIRAKGGSKSRRMNRKRANQLRGKINQYAREKAFAQGTVTVEVNPHGTSQYCSRCGQKGERFSLQHGKPR